MTGLAGAALGLLRGLLKLVPALAAYLAGKRGEAQENAEDALEAHKDAARVRNRLRSDDGFAERVREHYTR